MIRTAAVAVWAWTCVGAWALAQTNVAGTEPQFRPVLEKASVAPARVRPGETLGFTLTFRNAGTQPSQREHKIFVHFEDKQDCKCIRFQLDHAPTVPTTDWTPGKAIQDGPHGVQVPAGVADGEYWVHVGVCRTDPPLDRLYETYWRGKVVVDSAAPVGRAALEPLGKDELARRRGAAAKPLDGALTLGSQHIELRVSRATGAFQVLDKATGVVWGANPWRKALCELSVHGPEQSYRSVAGQFERVERRGDSIRLTHVPQVRGERLPISVEFTIRLLKGGRALELSYDARGDAGWAVAWARLLDEALWTTNEDGGYVVTPTLIGTQWPADSGRMFSRRMRTFAWGQLHMKMAGVVRQGSAALVSWDDPYVDLELKSHLGDWPAIPGRQIMTLSLIAQRTARRCRIEFLGRGGYVEIAKAYRRIAEKEGLLATWRTKLRANPDAAKVFGAPIIKPFVKSGVPPKSDRKPHVAFTFDETAQIAEHLKRDVGIDKCLFVLAGWLHKGYDSQHPDILPAAPECGGNRALADCARRVKALGYLFGMHDNYQDLYPDAPSWDERYLMRNRDGTIRRGGTWAGGPCWLINSKMGLQLAQRPQNLPAVKRLIAPTAYFTDTTFAAPLFEDFSAEHPLTRADDMHWKQALADYCIDLFGFHGSEMGYEWAVPHSHYFEGLLSRSPFLNEPGLGSRLIPLFELVYRDCIALYTHQGDRAGTGSAPFILYHLGLGRMPLYRFGTHLYWERDVPAGKQAAVASVRVRSMKLVAPRAVEATYEWKVVAGTSERAKAFVHFHKGTRQILFQNDHELAPPASSWQKGQTVVDGPHRFELPEGVRGTYDIWLGLFVPGAQRLAMAGQAGDSRVFGGRLHVGRDSIRLLLPTELEKRPVDCFARVDGGFAGKMKATDAFIRNTYEFMSPLNELTAQLPMTDHRFLTPDGLVEMTRFGADVSVVINASPKNATVQFVDGTAEKVADKLKSITLPPFGFVVHSPTFQAFHAMDWEGVRYDKPTLFTIRSLDGRPLHRSKRIRVYHAFGSPKLAIATRRAEAKGRVVVEVPGLEIITLP